MNSSLIAKKNCMQFIEKNSLNVRSAIYHLKKDDKKLEFILFPMIHIGTKEYYADISRRLANCDLILAEGVKSKKVRLLTLSYRIVKNIRRMELVTQSEGMHLSSFNNKLLNADMSGHIFDENWSLLPISIRVLMFITIPVYVVYMFFFGTRQRIAQNIALEDLPSRDETISEDEQFKKMDELLIDKRDQELIDRVAHLQDAEQYEKKTIGIIYGARHMRHVVNFLFQKWHYRIAKAEWVTVFEL